MQNTPNAPTLRPLSSRDPNMSKTAYFVAVCACKIPLTLLLSRPLSSRDPNMSKTAYFVAVCVHAKYP